jgi:hypothetical protein
MTIIMSKVIVLCDAMIDALVQNSIGWILICSMNTFIFQKWPQFRESSNRVIAVIAFKSPTFVYLWREITAMQ